MDVNTHSIRKAAGKASDDHPNNKTGLLRFADSIVEKAWAGSEFRCPTLEVKSCLGSEAFLGWVVTIKRR
jgi:hypothetical protein